jgi:hypothetical protein
MSQQNLYPPIESGEPSAPTDYTPTPGAEPVSNVDEDVIQAGLTKFKSISRAFQLHLLIAFSVCSILFFSKYLSNRIPAFIHIRKNETKI